MKKLQSSEELNTIINNGKSILMFSANWCSDCRFIEPFIDEVVEKYPNFTFIYVDRDEFIDLCGELEVMGIPSFIAFENGKQIGRFVNGKRKTREEIEAFIESL
ncbi:MAG: thiol reductase thioredoxin [Bacillales bacterium]|jgi:thiol-disulfide isomerase/thioredoxin|nr:thiol reductase thioredoxin [Bacillales bacterium]